MYCSKCGTALSDTAAFCSACGAPVGPAAATAPVVAPEPEPASQDSFAPQIVAVPKPVAYAGFWLRFVAFAIDLIIFFVLFVIVVSFLAVAMGLSAAIQQVQPGETPEALRAALGGGFLLAVLLILLAGSATYFSSLEASSWQGTIGKKALGLYVTDLAGNRISFGRSSVRFFTGKFIAIGVPGFGIMYFFASCICAGLTQRKQALHDMIAGCLVLKKP
ncbi:MAG: RDD family protein [Candidatus Acidiferrales bacterium]